MQSDWVCSIGTGNIGKDKYVNLIYSWIANWFTLDWTFLKHIDKNKLMKRMAEADEENLDDCAFVDEIRVIDLEGKKLKTVKHCFVD